MFKAYGFRLYPITIFPVGEVWVPHIYCIFLSYPKNPMERSSIQSWWLWLALSNVGYVSSMLLGYLKYGHFVALKEEKKDKPETLMGSLITGVYDMQYNLQCVQFLWINDQKGQSYFFKRVNAHKFWRCKTMFSIYALQNKYFISISII